MTASTAIRRTTRPHVETDHSVRSADGVRLATDVYLPQGDPTAIVLMRTPYDRARLRQDGLGWASAGIAAVVQDVRGRHGSDGSWTPYRRERADGAATLGWIRDRWPDVAIAPVGASYAAYTAWAAAVTAPDLVDGVVSLVPAAGTRAINYTAHGILRLAEHIAWWTEHAEGRTSRTGLIGPMMSDGTVVRTLPVASIGDALWADVPHWWSAVAEGRSGVHPADDGPEAITDTELSDLGVPTLHIGGWYDDFLGQTLHQWRTVGMGRPVRPARQLVVGPWDHSLSSPDRSCVGARSHARGSRLPLGRHQVDWVRALVGGVCGEAQDVYLPGAEGWVRSWPPSTRDLRLIAAADGSLVPAGPSSSLVWRGYDYDPLDPSPSVLAGVDGAGLHDHRLDRVALRHELTSPLTIAGSMRITLRTRSDRPGDRHVCVAERRSDGALIALAEEAVPVAAGDHVVTVDLPVTATTVPATSVLQLVVTGGSFPALARHPQTDTDRAVATSLSPARHEIALGDGTTSLYLPVVENPPVIHPTVPSPLPTDQEVDR